MCPAVTLLKTKQLSSKGIRYCRSCDRLISLGEYCLSYKKRGNNIRGNGRNKEIRPLSPYQCLGCAWRYNKYTVQSELFRQGLELNWHLKYDN